MMAFQILQIQRIAVSSFFLVRTKDVDCNKIRIVDLPDRQKCFVLSLDSDVTTFFYRMDRFRCEILTDWRICLHTPIHLPHL